MNRSRAKSNTFCVLPWTHLATHPQGGVSLCCRVDYTDGRGMSFNAVGVGQRDFLNLNRHGLNEVTNSDSFRIARAQMLAGDRPVACRHCFADEDRGLESKRQRENKVFANFGEREARMVTDANGCIEPDFRYVELRLGNLCNLKCRTCNPFSSTKWVGEYGKMQDELEFVRRYDLGEDFSWAEREEFWSDLLARSSGLTMMFINGGEPTLIAQHWAFLEKLVETGRAPKIQIKYNINMTHLPEKAFALWRQFASVFVGASIDDIGARNSYLRHGADWAVVLKNLRRLRIEGIPVAIEQTVSAMNLFYLDEAEDLARSIGIGYGLNFVYDPDFLSIQALPETARERALEKLGRSGKLSDRWLAEVRCRAVTEARGRPELWEQFKRYTNYLDGMRGESFSATFSEFNALLNETGHGF